MFGGAALALTVLAAVVQATGNVLLRLGIDRAGGFAPAGLADIPFAFLRLLLSPAFTAGFLLYFAAALIWFRVVAMAPLSVAYPLLVSLSFLLVAGAAALLLNEPMTARKAVGLLVIVAGIFLVSTDPGLVK